MRTYFSLLALAALLFGTGCGDSAPTALFQITYEPFSFGIPAGFSSIQSFVQPIPMLRTNFERERAAANVDVNEIDFVGGFRARLVSVNGEDFSQFERAELRFCPVGQVNGCERLEFMFSTGDLFGRRLTVIDLSPQLKNFRDLFLMNEEVRAEIVLFPGRTTNRTIEARLEYTIAAFDQN